MKKIIAVVISCIMVLNIIQPQIIDTTKQVRAASNGEFAGGTGTANDPYQIETAEQLNNVRNYMKSHFVLNRDIDMSNIKNFVPIGTKENPFEGFFNGNNHTINNLTIKQDDLDAVGLFGNSKDGDFRNISLDNLLIQVDKKSYDYTSDDLSSIYVGGIVGCRETYDTYKNKILNCEVKGKISVVNSHNVYIGGIAGVSGKVYSCKNYAKINIVSNKDGRWVNDGDVKCGGIVGHSSAIYGIIENCHNYGDIKGVSGNQLEIGGISGEQGSISRCNNYGNISGRTTQYWSWGSGSNNCNSGGIVGDTYGDTFYCINYGNVYAKAENGASAAAGGIAGYSGFYGSGRVQYCINSGNSIISQREKKESGKYVNTSGNLGRILGVKSGYATGGIKECYSSDQTLLNGQIPTDKIDTEQINGQSLSSEELKTKIKNNYADERNAIKLCPENNKINVKAKNAKGLYDIEVQFDGKVTAKKGLITIKKQNDVDHSIKSYSVSSKLVEIKDDVLKIKDVKLPYGQDISILFDKNCIEVDGKVFLGFRTENDWTFRTEEPDFSDYDKYQANYLSQNAESITAGQMIYSDLEDNYTPTQYAINNITSFIWNSKFKFSDASQVWETVLMDTMLRKSYDKEARDAFLKNSAKMEVKVLKVIDEKQGIKETAKLTQENKEKISNTLKDAKIEDVKIMSGMLDAAETAKDFVDKYTKYLELKKEVSSDTTKFLKEMKSTKNYREIPAFQRAVDRIVDCMDINRDDMLGKLGQAVLKNKTESMLFTESVNTLTENLMDMLLPGMTKVLNFTKDTTMFIMDNVCGVSQLAEVNLYLYMLDCIDESAKEAFNNCAAKNIASNGEEKVKAINGGMQFLIDLQTYGVSVGRKRADQIVKKVLELTTSNSVTTVNNPYRDLVNARLNLKTGSKREEKKKYIENKCQENEKWITGVKNLKTFAFLNWYEETNTDDNMALLMFVVENPDGSKNIYAKQKAINTKIEFPTPEAKTGYTASKSWYTDEECKHAVSGSQTVSGNTIFYTKYTHNILFDKKQKGEIKINKFDGTYYLNGKNTGKTRAVQNAKKCEIPSYIDGYKVTELGKDIFSELPDMTEIYIPPTVKTINKDAFKSLPKETLYRCDKKSYAEDFLHDNKYKNVRVEDNTPKPKTVKVSQIKLTGISNKIAAGKKIKLTATINPKNATKKTLKWTTNNKKIATVDKNGVVTINKKAGGKTVKITAEATDGSKKKATFTIKIMKGVVKKVKISGSKTVKSGKTLKLKAKVTASKGANKSLKWTSSNTKYATVTSSGKVKALKAGKKKTVKITAMAVDGSGKKATFKVKIK